jgi:DNA-binding transcriptional MocR family regulator
LPRWQNSFHEKNENQRRVYRLAGKGKKTLFLINDMIENKIEGNSISTSDRYPDHKVAIPRWSQEGNRRTYGLLKQLVSNVQGADSTSLIGLHGGLPPAECFPLSTIELTLRNGQSIRFDAQAAQEQYNVSPSGYPPLQNWCEVHTNRMHNPPPKTNHRTVITDGSTHALDILLSLFLNPEDIIIVEEYSYSHFLECIVAPKSYKAVGVRLDEKGMDPAHLEEVLHQHLAKDIDGGSIKLLYTIPVGQNPTGIVNTPERTSQIYALCKKYDVFIIEDDPYSYIQFKQFSVLEDLRSNSSYLSMDVDGRVIRVDSFAKTIAPGFRLGWLTAASYVCERFCMALQGTSLGGNMMSQVVLYHLLEDWGDEGLVDHLQKLRTTYSNRANVMYETARKELQGLAHFSKPEAGMFMVSEFLF